MEGEGVLLPVVYDGKNVEGGEIAESAKGAVVLCARGWNVEVLLCGNHGGLRRATGKQIFRERLASQSAVGYRACGVDHVHGLSTAPANDSVDYGVVSQAG